MFKNSIYTHSFLNANDYYRYHIPVTGEIKEVRKIHGRVYIDVIRKADGNLQAWRKETPNAKPTDWIFASPRTRGKKPYRGNSLVRRQLKLAKERAGIVGPVGWHTFRRSIATWLIENDENVKVTQELLRHHHVGTTLDLYAKAVTRTKRQAQEKIVKQLLSAQQQASKLESLQVSGVVQ